MRRSIRRKAALVLACGMLAFIMAFTLVELRVRPLVEDFAASRARQLATELIDTAVAALLESADPLVAVTRGADGVASAEVNTRAIAALRTAAVTAIADRLTGASPLALEVPLFNLSGSVLFSGFGIPVTVQLLPVGDILADVRTDFLESGINQTLHVVDLRVRVTLRLLVGRDVVSVDIVSDIPLAETLIVGAVPEAYTAINRFEVDEQEENDLNDYAAVVP